MSRGTVQKIRTFKADLEAARARSGANSATSENLASPKRITPAIGTPRKEAVSPIPDSADTVMPNSTKPQVKPAVLPSTSTDKTTTPTDTPINTEDITPPLTSDAPGQTDVPRPTPAENNTIDLDKDDETTFTGTTQPLTENVPQELKVNTMGVELPDANNEFTDDIEGGTIVSNKRTGHYSIWDALKDNVSSWQTKRKQQAKAKKAAEPKVTSAESRIDTLREAAKGSYRAPQADHGILLKQLKKRKPEKLPESNIVVKEKEDVPEPSWKHIIDDTISEETITPTKPDIDTTIDTDTTASKKLTVSESQTETAAPDVAVNEPYPEKNEIPQPTPLDTTDTKKPIEEPQPATASADTLTTPPVPTSQPEPPSTPTPITPAPKVMSEPEVETHTGKDDMPTPDSDEDNTIRRPISVYQWPRQGDVPKEVPSEPTPPTPTPAAAPGDTPSAKDTPAAVPTTKQPEPTEETTDIPNTPTPTRRTHETRKSSAARRSLALRPTLMTIVIVVVIVGAGGGAWYLWQQSATTPTTEPTTTQELLAGDVDHLVSLDDGVDSIFSTIYTHMVESRDLITHTFVTTNNTVADPSDVITTLNFRLTGSFARALTGITIGSLDGTEPFIVLRATNFDTAFAGMLAWEQSLSIDVAPLFGKPIVESFDSNARTDTQIRSAFYTDAVVANTSVRILRDASNATRIIYGFADPNTIIITTNATAYEHLLTRLRE